MRAVIFKTMTKFLQVSSHWWLQHICVHKTQLGTVICAPSDASSLKRVPLSLTLLLPTANSARLSACTFSVHLPFIPNLLANLFCTTSFAFCTLYLAPDLSFCTRVYLLATILLSLHISYPTLQAPCSPLSLSVIRARDPHNSSAILKAGDEACLILFYRLAKTFPDSHIVTVFFFFYCPTASSLSP